MQPATKHGSTKLILIINNRFSREFNFHYKERLKENDGRENLQLVIEISFVDKVVLSMRRGLPQALKVISLQPDIDFAYNDLN